MGSWYGERKNSFGFSADGEIGRLPHVTCDVKQPLPAPPPPSPPFSPPAVPPYYTASERACFLGGGAEFIRAPNLDPVSGWLHPWTVSVRLQRWIVGTQIVLDFTGANLHTHPIKILRVTPGDARLAACRHPALQSRPLALFKASQPNFD